MTCSPFPTTHQKSNEGSSRSKQIDGEDHHHDGEPGTVQSLSLSVFILGHLVVGSLEALNSNFDSTQSLTPRLGRRGLGSEIEFKTQKNISCTAEGYD